jgi:hypothetical protein
MLDRQFYHFKHDSIQTLGHWVDKKRKQCNKRLEAAQKVVKGRGVPEETLRHEWKAQVKAQTASLESKFI